MHVVFKGTVVKVAEYGVSADGGDTLISPMQILTPNGVIDVNLTDSWYPEPKIGDLVECNQGSGYFVNGRLTSCADKEIVINGAIYKE